MSKVDLKKAVLSLTAKHNKYADSIDLLNKKFSIDNFGNFCCALFNQSYDKNNVVEIEIKDKDFKGVKNIVKVAEYEDDDMELLICLAVKLDKNTYKGNQRAYQRGVVSYILNRSREWKKAIVAFYAEGEQVWRLSYINVGEYNENDIVVPLYRWSYLVGEEEPNRTIKDHVQKIIGKFDAFDSGQDNKPSVEEIESIFTESDAVTNNFYEQFMLHYRILKEDLIGNYGLKYIYDIERVVKNIMGQVVALFFLQKCGFLGVKEGEEWGSGDKYYLTKLVDEYKGLNIYKDIFMNLMSALSGDSIIDGEITPVLNGGLFTTIDKFNDGTIFNMPTDKFKSFINMLREFNFTVSESTGYDKEVAVDPEMLGKIYESFISTDDEKGENIKKLTGAVYTPVDIVNYMSKESVINWLLGEVNGATREALDELINIQELNIDLLNILNTEKDEDGKVIREGVMEEKFNKKGYVSLLKGVDKKLEGITILEPAVGSGVFILGMLNVVTRLRHNIGVILLFLRQIDIHVFKSKYGMYDLKLHTINNSLHGVDINIGAIDIARLRLWLSLIVDMEQPRPLPNLGFKIVVGNSVVDRSAYGEVFAKGCGVDLSKFGKLKKEFLTIGHSNKNSMLNKITEEIKNILINVDGSRADNFNYSSIDGTLLKDMVDYSQLVELFKNKFSYYLFFDEVMKDGGFDIVISNPPYLQGVSIKKEIKQELVEKYRVFQGRADLFVYFYEQGYELLKDNGVLGFLTSNSWLLADYSRKLREFLKENTELLLVVDFKGSKVFKSVGVDVAITMARKKYPNEDHEIIYCDAEKYEVR